MTKTCYNCKFAGCDPDGPYCGHKESFKLTGFGASFNRMHVENLCNDSKQLWQAK